MISLWADTATMPRFAALERDTDTDILIIGGGMAGVLCSYLLRQAGAEHILLEARRVGSGITRNTTAKITAQHGLIYQQIAEQYGVEQARNYLLAQQEALEQYARLAEGCDCDFRREEHIVYARQDLEPIARELEILKKLGDPAEFVRDLPLPFPVAGGIMFPRQANFHPLKFLAHISAGLPVYEHTPVLELEGMNARTPRARVRAKKIIVATHFPFINKHGAYFLKLHQQRSYVLALEKAGRMRGMYIGAEENGLSFRRWGELLLLGGGGRELEEFARRYYPRAKVKYRWATQDCMTLDGLPYIGRYAAGAPDMYVATGFNKWGMSSSMAAALILTDMLRGRDDPFAAIFAPERKMALPQLKTNIAESAKNLLRLSRPRCPHLGCALKWNAMEQSWDCPCHGSRFTGEGRLLDGPATGDLHLTRRK